MWRYHEAELLSFRPQRSFSSCGCRRSMIFFFLTRNPFIAFSLFFCTFSETSGVFNSWCIIAGWLGFRSRCVKLDGDSYDKWIEGFFRRRKMELLSEISIPDDSCHICYSSSIDTVLKPCGHRYVGDCFKLSGWFFFSFWGWMRSFCIALTS